MTNELKPVHFRVPKPGNPNHSVRYFSANDTVADTDENRNAEPLYSQQQVDQLQAQIAAQQAKIDALMLEYCPDEMGKEQTDNWAEHQKKVTVQQCAPDDGWIEWSGGDMPVAEGVFVDVKFRNGKRFLNYSATEYYWSRDVNEGGCDIIAYRVVKPC